MQVAVYIPELDHSWEDDTQPEMDVVFTGINPKYYKGDNFMYDSRTIDPPEPESVEFKDIVWDEKLYTAEQNNIIKGYVVHAKNKLEEIYLRERKQTA